MTISLRVIHIEILLHKYKTNAIILHCVGVWSLLGAKYDLFLIGPNPQVGGGGGEWVILLGTSEVK